MSAKYIVGIDLGTTNSAMARYDLAASEEDQPVTVEAGFDTAAIKLIGNVAGRPPLRGLLRHKGWRAEKIDLPALAAGQSAAILAPAEVEIE